jgi:hypothetical protein
MTSIMRRAAGKCLRYRAARITPDVGEAVAASVAAQSAAGLSW